VDYSLAVPQHVQMAEHRQAGRERQGHVECDKGIIGIRLWPPATIRTSSPWPARMAIASSRDCRRC
jgi:hypothetical protein